MPSCCGPVLTGRIGELVVAAPVVSEASVVDRGRAGHPRFAHGVVLPGEGTLDALAAVEHLDSDIGRPVEATLMVIRVAAVDLEIRAELVIDAAAVILEEGARILVGDQVGDRTRWVNSPRARWATPTG